MKRLLTLIERNIAGKKVLALFLLTNAVYVYMLAFTIPGTMKFSNGMKLLDMMPTGYDLNYVNTLFSSLGEEGRQAYLTTQIPPDMVYPILFGLSYCLLTGYFLKKLQKLNTHYLYIGVLPIISAVADYVENVGIIVMLNRYPNLTQDLVSFTNVFSVIKSISTSLFFIALIGLLLSFGVKSISRKKTNDNVM
ncbi:hypothetical protein [Nibribacter koreensis]|uniref:hypothetical protein n=1 Tax=Nibribacter koreensis TaxID=1084519 RepID=UPI0031EE04FB